MVWRRMGREHGIFGEMWSLNELQKEKREREVQRLLGEIENWEAGREREAEWMI